MSKNHQSPNGLNESDSSLKVYQDYDYVIYAKGHESGEYVLEIGEDIIFEGDRLSDDEIVEKAKEEGYLDTDLYDYVDEDGTVDIESLRDTFRNQEAECPKLESTPSGRARILFEPLLHSMPSDIGIRLEKSHTMGNDWAGIVVEGVESLINIQLLMKEKGIRINFELGTW
jgi:hypothetical protein